MRILVGLLCAALCLCSCGKKGPLIYPEMLAPAAPTMATATQTGNVVRLSFDVPAKDRAGRALKDVAGVTVLRRSSMSGQMPGCNACITDFSVLRKLYLEAPESDVRRYGSLMVLLDSDVRMGRDYSYRMVPFMKDGVEGEMSATVTASVVQSPLPPVLHAIPSPTEVRLEFVALRPDVGTLVGYTVYRAPKGKPFEYLPLNKGIIEANVFSDQTLERGVLYTYAVRAVARLDSGALVESVISNEVDARLVED